MHKNEVYKTDWDRYYSNEFFASKFTRKYTGWKLVNLLNKYLKDYKKNQISITEFGGANSCFFLTLNKNFHLTNYTVIDNNNYGLNLFKNLHKNNEIVNCICADVLDNYEFEKTDIVYSIGLIEHFDQNGTEKAVKMHLKTLKPGGILILSFPTPTFLYKKARFLAELTNNWIFHDERPIIFEEVETILKNEGDILHREILYPLVFKQGLIVFRKKT